MKNRKPLYVISAIVVVVLAIVVLNLPKNESQKVSEVTKTQSSSTSSSEKHVKKNRKKQHAVNNESHQSGKRTTENTSNNNGADPEYGNLGYFNIPSEYWGTWYSADDDGNIQSMTINQHSIGENTTYKKNPQYWQSATAIKDQNELNRLKEYTKNWIATDYLNLAGKPAVHCLSWLSTMGFGEYYQVRQEEGQSVLIYAGAQDPVVYATYYKTPELAKQNIDKKYSDLPYPPVLD